MDLCNVLQWEMGISILVILHLIFFLLRHGPQNVR